MTELPLAGKVANRDGCRAWPRPVDGARAGAKVRRWTLKYVAVVDMKVATRPDRNR